MVRRGTTKPEDTGVSKDVVDKVARALADLGDPPKKARLTKTDAVAHLYDSIAALKARGWTLAQIAQVFRDNGVGVTDATVRKAFSDVEKARGNKPKKARRSYAASRTPVPAASPAATPASDSQEVTRQGGNATQERQPNASGFTALLDPSSV